MLKTADKIRIFKTVDPRGTIILQEDKVYRGINALYVSHITEVIEKCRKAGLFGNYIIETTIIDSFLKQKNHSNFSQFGMIVEHEKVPMFSYPAEWSSNMFYDAGLMVLDLLIQLDEIGLTLQDCHLWNITFFKGKFLWIDLSSIVNKNQMKSKYIINAIRDNFINTLILTSIAHQDKKVSNLLKCGMIFSQEDVFGYMNSIDRYIYKFYELKTRSYAYCGNLKKMFLVLKKWLSLYSPKIKKSRWKDYQDDLFIALGQEELLDKRSAEIISFFKEFKPQQVLDIGGNAGYYCFWVEKLLGANSIVCDIDYESVNIAYQKIKLFKMQHIVPIYMDILSPTPSLFIDSPCEDDGCIILRDFTAKKRFKSDVVLALALIHHLFFFKKITFDEIIAQLASFTTKYLVIEFIHPHDQHVKQWLEKERSEDYNFSNFKNSLQDKFFIMKEVNTLRDERTVLFCKLIH